VGVARDPPEGADLVVGVDLDGFVWARRRRVPFVASLKGIIADEMRNERGWVRVLLGVQARWEWRNTARADLVVVPSYYSARVVERVYDVPPARIAVVPEPIDVDAWATASRGRRAAREPGRSFSACAHVPEETHRRPDRGGEPARGKMPEVRVRIVGRPEWEPARRPCASLGLGDRVTLLGDVSRALAEEYVNADCFCLPTVQEGFGVVFLEAMSVALPVVACRAAAVPEVVLDGETGVLVPPRDSEALAETLARLLADPARMRALGEAGRRRAAAFTPERVAGRFLEAVAPVLAAPGA
jgi:glycosyltransferase involved in cell wall biosynthesis